MRRNIRVPWQPPTPPQLERLEKVPSRVVLNLRAAGTELTPTIGLGETIAVCQKVATSPAIDLHSPISGRITELNRDTMIITRTESDQGTWMPGSSSSSSAPAFSGDLPAFLTDIGLLGMGGGQFPAAWKAMAAQTTVHTLIINAVECEPGITIDRAVLEADAELLLHAAQTVAQTVGADNIILAAGGEKQHLFGTLAKTFPDFCLLHFPGHYPLGAETLILKKIMHRLPPPGALPVQLGYLVHNLTSLRALGRALRDGVPVVERPLTLAAPTHDYYRNLIVPLGLEIGELLTTCGVPFAPAEDVVIIGGLMMGRRHGPDAPAVDQGTTSVLVIPRSQLPGPEVNCIRCGACHDACPLQLHPIGLAQRLNQRNSAIDPAVQAQLRRCFLCGACATVCPSHIALAQTFRVAKKHMFNGPIKNEQ